MSNPADNPSRAQLRSSIDPRVGLIVRVAEQLVPLFRGPAIDSALAHQMAISAIGAYLPESRADFVSVARTIAFSMAALALLGKAVAEDLTMAEKMRAYGRANALNRSADQSERTMMQRRRAQQANPPPDLPAWMDPRPESTESDDELDDATVEAAVAEALQASRAQATPAAHTEAVKTVPDKPAMSQPSSMPSSVRPPVKLPQAAPPTAIRYTGPRPDAGQPQAMPYREGLLRHSALQRVMRESSTQQTM